MLLDPLIALTLWKIVLQTNCFSSKVKEILFRFIWWSRVSATVQVRLSSPTMMPCLPTWWGHTQNGFLTLFTPAGGISLQPMKNLKVNHFSPYPNFTSITPSYRISSLSQQSAIQVVTNAGTVRLIDLEYSGPNYAAFDIANLFNE